MKALDAMVVLPDGKAALDLSEEDEPLAIVPTDVFEKLIMVYPKGDEAIDKVFNKLISVRKINSEFQNH